MTTTDPDHPAPLPVLPLEYAPPELSGRSRVLRVTSWASITILAIGSGAIYLTAESVLVSGPALAITGVIMLVMGIMRRQMKLWGPGLAHLGITVLFVALVNLLHWGPDAAKIPFAVMSTIYTITMALILFKLRSDERRRAF